MAFLNQIQAYVDAAPDKDERAVVKMKSNDEGIMPSGRAQR